uniref:Ral transcription factor IIIC subunit 5 n=1 Tax=Lates calcarifer TaxID=8187 RepID=A0A4W6FCU3_LATCA
MTQRKATMASSTVELRDNRLVCVEYPGVISSVPRMLETLGTFAHPNRRLELRYRPQDPFCHSLCGNRFSSSNLLLRVRRRVRKKDPKDAEIHMDVLGVIGTTYKFQGLADFQCLAVHSEGGKDMSLYDKIILRKSENQAFFEQPMPYFLPPAIFSRLDSPVDYFYRPDVSQHQLHLNKKNFIGLNRARRPHNAIFVSFTDPTVPADLWVKLGYDPRKTTESKKYQMLDFRIRCSTKDGYSLSDMPVKAKRSALNYTLPITFNKAGEWVNLFRCSMEVCFTADSHSRKSTGESSYIFREGMLPPHRQMFYQLCDLDVESIKQVIEKNSGNEQVCNERDGWCIVGTTDKLRDMISAMIKKVIRAQKPGQSSKSSMRDVEAEEEEEEDGENEEDDDDDFQPSEGSENEMETEILDYM